jgi:hypothetical protein
MSSIGSRGDGGPHRQAVPDMTRRFWTRRRTGLQVANLILAEPESRRGSRVGQSYGTAMTACLSDRIPRDSRRLGTQPRLAAAIVSVLVAGVPNFMPPCWAEALPHRQVRCRHRDQPRPGDRSGEPTSRRGCHPRLSFHQGPMLGGVDQHQNAISRLAAWSIRMTA